MHTAWLAVLYTCTITGALSLTGAALVAAYLAREVHRDWKQRRRVRRQAAARVVAGAEALLRDAAGDAR